MTRKTWLVHLENPYKAEDVWGCGACQQHIDFAKKHNMLVLVDESGDIQGVTFNHVMGKNIKDIKIEGSGVTGGIRLHENIVD